MAKITNIGKSDQVKEFKTTRITPDETRTEVPFFEDINYDFRTIRNKRHVINHVLEGSTAATASNYGTIWIAPYACTVKSVREVHEVAGSAGGSVTLDIEKLTGTQAPGAGVSILSSTIDLKGTANTVVKGTLTATRADKNLAEGDRLALIDTGTLTSLSNVVVIIEVEYQFTLQN